MKMQRLTWYHQRGPRETLGKAQNDFLTALLGIQGAYIVSKHPSTTCSLRRFISTQISVGDASKHCCASSSARRLKEQRSMVEWGDGRMSRCTRSSHPDQGSYLMEASHAIHEAVDVASSSLIAIMMKSRHLCYFRLSLGFLGQ